MSGQVKMTFTENKFPLLRQLLGREKDATARELARLTLAYCDEECPVETGALRETGDISQSGSGAYQVTYGGGEVDYAVPVHEGHDLPNGGHVPANPWVVRGARRASEDMPDLIYELTGRVVGL